MEYLFLLSRVLFGGYFFKSGWNHFRNLSAMAGYAASRGVPQPKLAVAGSGALIFLGGLGILLGIWVEWSVIAIALFLIPVTFTMHAYWNDADPMMKMNNRIQFGKNLALLGAAIAYLFIALPWPLSL